MAQPAAVEEEHTRFISSSAIEWTTKPVTGFLEVCNEPILCSEEDEDVQLERRGDLLAPLKVNKWTRKVWAAVLAEFVGMAIFEIYGGNAPDSVAAYGNGITLGILVYITANVSGGHLNPAVTFATCLTGHTSWAKGGLYVIAQVMGGIFGSLMGAVLIPSVTVGGGDSMPGCFTHEGGVTITKGQLFLWEMIMTFVLVSTVYAVAVTKPGHGNIGPLAVGFSLFASAFIGGQFTGAALNPARVLGPAIVFHCYWDTAFIYVFGELFGGLLAAIIVLPLYGFGQFGSLLDTRLCSALGIKIPEKHQHRFVLARDNDMEMGPLQEQPHSPAPVRPPKPSLASLAERPHPPPQGYRPQPDPWRVGAQI
ncbi:hypothetical protein WJX82_007201 [Trebouxia sp. C0006]